MFKRTDNAYSVSMGKSGFIPSTKTTIRSMVSVIDRSEFLIAITDWELTGSSGQSFVYNRTMLGLIVKTANVREARNIKDIELLSRLSR